MSTSNRNTNFIQQFTDFLTFLKNLWGALAGISVFFPLSNVLAKLIPLDYFPQGGLAYISPILITMLATVTALFIVLMTFAQSDRLHQRHGRQVLWGWAWQSFATASVALAIYLVIYFAVQSNFYFGVLGWSSGDGRRAIGDVVLSIAYCLFFAQMTRAFVVLGMLEYFRQSS